MNSYIHGFYSKYLPKQTYDIMKDMGDLSPLDMLRQDQICCHYQKSEGYVCKRPGRKTSR